MQWERKTGRSWGTRTRRCPCLERSFNVQRSNIPHWRLEFHPPNKLPSILLLGPVTSHLTRSTKEPIVDRFFGRKARQIYFFFRRDHTRFQTKATRNSFVSQRSSGHFSFGSRRHRQPHLSSLSDYPYVMPRRQTNIHQHPVATGGFRTEG